MRTKAYTNLHREMGLCYDCNQPAIPYGRRCQFHTDQNRAACIARNMRTYKERIEAGLCLRCGGERDGVNKYCLNCREATSRRNRI